MKKKLTTIEIIAALLLGAYMIGVYCRPKVTDGVTPHSYISPAEDSLRAVITAQDSIIAMFELSKKTELDTIYIDRIRYREAEQLTLATPDSLQTELFLRNYPSLDSFPALLSPPIPIPSIRLANVAFVKLGAATSENKHLWSITEKQETIIVELEKKCLNYNDLALAISAERDSCALDNGALTEEVFEQGMVIDKQGKIIKWGTVGVVGYILARVMVKLVF